MLTECKLVQLEVLTKCMYGLSLTVLILLQDFTCQNAFRSDFVLISDMHVIVIYITKDFVPRWPVKVYLPGVPVPHGNSVWETFDNIIFLKNVFQYI